MSRHKASRGGRQNERPSPAILSKARRNARPPIASQLDRSLDAAIRAAQKRNPQKTDRAIRELFRDRPELQARFGVEPKRKGRPLGSRETPSKVKLRIYVARSFGIRKVTILKAIGYSPDAAAYRFIDRAVAEVEADQRRRKPTFNVKVSRARYTILTDHECAERLIRELHSDRDSLERV